MHQKSVKVIPICVTKVDWASFVQFAQSTFGIISIDEQNETTRFIKSLKNTDRFKNPLKHLHLTVGIEGNQKIANYLYECDCFKIWTHIEEEDNVAIIISSDFDSWKKQIERACQKESDFKIRVLFNKVFLIFERGSSDVVEEWQKMSLSDGSFTIKRRM